MDPSSSNKTIEKQPINHDPIPLKCPRCDSSNTKFCYYNNYSLSQPRHFCKACKRYWTRGGTLRSVPVGGGCRKNKRVKRTQPANDNGIGVSTAVTSHVQPLQISNLSQVSNQMSSSLFYNTQPTNNNLGLNFPFSTFSLSGVSSSFDFQQPHLNMNGFGLGFPSGLLTNESAESQGRIQDFIDQQDRLIMGSTGSFGSTSTMTSLLSSLQHPKSVANGHDTGVKNGYEISNGIQVKVEAEKRSNEYQNNQLHDDQQQLNRSSDANSSILWNTSNVSPWFDPSNNLGSSVPSLI